MLAVKVERSLRSRMVAAILGMRWTTYMGMTVGEGIKSVLIEGGQVGAGGLALVQALGNFGIAVVFFGVAAAVSPRADRRGLRFRRHHGARLPPRRAEGAGAESRHLGRVGAGSPSRPPISSRTRSSTGRPDSRGAALEIVDDQFGEWASSYGKVQRYVPTTRLAFDAAGLTFIAVVLSLSLFVLDTSIAGPLVFLALFYRLSPRLQAAQQGYLQARTQVAWWHTWKEQYEAALAETDATDRHPPVRRARRASSSTT